MKQANTTTNGLLALTPAKAVSTTVVLAVAALLIGQSRLNAPNLVIQGNAPESAQVANIRKLYQTVLPGCENETQIEWMANAVTTNQLTLETAFQTLQTVAASKPSCLKGAAAAVNVEAKTADQLAADKAEDAIVKELSKPQGTFITADDIKARFEHYLPGCWTQKKDNDWAAWFKNGGSMNDFEWTLNNVAKTQPPCLKTNSASKTEVAATNVKPEVKTETKTATGPNWSYAQTGVK